MIGTLLIANVPLAVTHEHVQPLQHTKHEHRITREVHTHDIYHRILPIIETEILPPRHFVDDGHDIREVPESEVWKYTVTGARGYRQPQAVRQEAQSETSPPEQSSLACVATNQEPILAEKKTYMTEGGYPRTEYLWLHPPVFEDASGRTQPVLIPAGLSPAWKARLGVADHGAEQRTTGVIVMAEEDVIPSAKRRQSWDTSGARTEPNDQLHRETEEEETRRQQQQQLR